MTYTVKFNDFQISDDKDALTIESVYKKYAAISGVHSFQFDDAMNTWENSEWTAPAGVTLGNVITATATDVVDRPVWSVNDFPHSYTIEFTAIGFWEVRVRGDGADTYYKISYESTLYGIEHVVDGTVVSGLKKGARSLQYSEYPRVKISVRDAQFTSDSAGRTIHIAVWVDDYLLHTFSEDAPTNPPLKTAFVVLMEDGTGERYTDFRMPDLGEIILVSSLDPAENPIGAIQRAIEDRYVRAWIRWNGSLRAWNPKARPLALTITPDAEYNYSPSIDVREAASHIRVMGAFQWVQLIDEDLLRDNSIGHRFREINNTAVWNIDDLERIGAQLFIRIKEQIYQAQIDTFGMHFNELEDRISAPNHRIDGQFQDYILDTLTLTWMPNTFSANANMRRYYYGDP